MSRQDFLARHQVCDVIDGVVTKQVPFGSFVESEGFTGLAHQQSPPPQLQRTPRESSADRFACTDATARNASRR